MRSWGRNGPPFLIISQVFPSYADPSKVAQFFAVLYWFNSGKKWKNKKAMVTVNVIPRNDESYTVAKTWVVVLRVRGWLHCRRCWRIGGRRSGEANLAFRIEIVVIGVVAGGCLDGRHISVIRTCNAFNASHVIQGTLWNVSFFRTMASFHSFGICL